MVSVRTVHMQPIQAAAGFRGVEFQAQVVPADEPVKGSLRLLVPPSIGSGSIGRQTRRDSRLSVNRLLIEKGADAATPVKSVRADGPEMLLL